uniref:Tripartite motif-containing protein 16-like n=1 Tax=Sinocyclocheilus anshuiensis TaxID=1608454 RepID=A0A671NCN6_9TELE
MTNWPFLPFSQDEFTCPVCLDLLKDPVTIQCGHSYCKCCITGCWDHEDQKRVYSCPQCKQTFSPRPALARNTMLTELKIQSRQVLSGVKVTDATGRLQEMICQKHAKHLEMYCITDQQFICVLCTKYEHKNHDTVSAAAQRTEKQVINTSDQVNTQSVEDSERVFTELIRSIESSRSELLRLIRDQEKTAVSRAEGRLERLEQEINDLRRRDAELEQLSHTQDHIQFLQLTLNPNTAHKRLHLSESNRVITNTGTLQLYPDHPERFDEYLQVLCSGSVCGRCYWEQEWSGRVFISVSYNRISRKGGNECVFGSNDQSWSLICSPSSYSFTHNNIRTDLSVKSISSRIGVFVDHSAGTLSFYSVSDTMSLIHTVQTTFTQPLYPGFGVYRGSSVKLC